MMSENLKWALEMLEHFNNHPDGVVIKENKVEWNWRGTHSAPKIKYGLFQTLAADGCERRFCQFGGVLTLEEFECFKKIAAKYNIKFVHDKKL